MQSFDRVLKPSYKTRLGRVGAFMNYGAQSTTSLVERQKERLANEEVKLSTKNIHKWWRIKTLKQLKKKHTGNGERHRKARTTPVSGWLFCLSHRQMAKFDLPRPRRNMTCETAKQALRLACGRAIDVLGVSKEEEKTLPLVVIKLVDNSKERPSWLLVKKRDKEYRKDQGNFRRLGCKRGILVFGMPSSNLHTKG